MQIPPLSPELEAELFAAAVQFRLAQPWKVLDNVHYLLVEDPAGYRSITVMGAGRKQYGLQAFEPDTATRFLYLSEDISRGLVSAGWAIDLFATLRGVELELMGRTKLPPEDLFTAVRLGYFPKPRERQAWPSLRQFRPGYFAGALDEAGAKTLLLDLRRALRWAELKPQVVDEIGPLPCPLDERALPVVAADLPTDRPWTPADLRWDTLNRMQPPLPERLALDYDAAGRWASREVNPEISWVLQERVLPTRLVRPGEYLARFSRLAIVVDASTGQVLAHGLEEAPEGLGRAALKALASVTEQEKELPGRLIFVDPQLHEALAEWWTAFPAQTLLAAPPPIADQLWEHIRSSM